ncbi:MAG: hypothetical protein AAFR88_05090 [Pseudomonadota bacterium]
MSWVSLLLALGLAFIAYKVLMGVLRVAVIIGLLGLGYYAYSSGVLA